MGRWYDSVDNKSSNIVYSRIRLARNWDEYTFPSRMTREQFYQVYVDSAFDGLHPDDIQRVIAAYRKLQKPGDQMGTILSGLSAGTGLMCGCRRGQS